MMGYQVTKHVEGSPLAEHVKGGCRGSPSGEPAHDLALLQAVDIILLCAYNN